MSFELTTQIKLVNPASNLDEMYGVYSTVQEALNTIPIVLREEGRTFGVIENGKVVEYWWPTEGSLGDNDIEVKGGDGSTQLYRIHNDISELLSSQTEQKEEEIQVVLDVSSDNRFDFKEGLGKKIGYYKYNGNSTNNLAVDYDVISIPFGRNPFLQLAIETLEADKVDVEQGKSLVDNDEIAKLLTVSLGAEKNPDKATQQELDEGTEDEIRSYSPKQLKSLSSPSGEGIPIAETEVTTGGAIIAQPTPTSFLKFINQTTPVILAGMAGTVDGKEVTIWNKTMQSMDILHQSQSATSNNRLSILGEQDIQLPINVKATFRYSASSSKWEMITMYGAGYEPTLIGIGERAVIVNGEGNLHGEEIVDIKGWNFNITSNQSKEDLNTLYPDAKQGFIAVAPENGREYELIDETERDWIYREIFKVV